MVETFLADVRRFWSAVAGHRFVWWRLDATVGPTVTARLGLRQAAGCSKAFHKNDITYSTEVKTAHVKWARKLPGSPIKGFFIPSVQYGRDMVELMQRLDLDPTTVSIDRKWDINCWGIGDYYGHEARGDRDDFQIVYSYAERDLTGPTLFEVMVIPGLNGWSRMTRSTRDAILKRVANGAGLVLIHPFVGDVKNHSFKGDGTEGDARIWEISPLVGCPDDRVDDRGYPEINQAAVSKGKWEIALQHFITSGQSLELLPEASTGGSFYKYTSNGDVLIKSGEYPILAVKKYGKGRVAAFVPGFEERANIGTFHSFCGQVLRQHGVHLGIDPDFAIYSVDDDRKAVLEDALRRAQSEGHRG